MANRRYGWAKNLPKPCAVFEPYQATKAPARKTGPRQGWSLLDVIEDRNLEMVRVMLNRAWS